MKKVTREQWKQWGKWRREGAAAKKACYRAMLTQRLPKDFVFDPSACVWNSEASLRRKRWTS